MPEISKTVFYDHTPKGPEHSYISKSLSAHSNHSQAKFPKGKVAIAYTEEDSRLLVAIGPINSGGSLVSHSDLLDKSGFPVQRASLTRGALFTIDWATKSVDIVGESIKHGAIPEDFKEIVAEKILAMAMELKSNVGSMSCD